MKSMKTPQELPQTVKSVTVLILGNDVVNNCLMQPKLLQLWWTELSCRGAGMAQW